MNWNLSERKFKSSFLHKFLSCKLHDTNCDENLRSLNWKLFWELLYILLVILTSPPFPPPWKKIKRITCLPLTGMFWISYLTAYVEEDWAKSLAHLLNRSSWRSGRHRRFPPSWSSRCGVHSFTSSSTSSCSVHPSTSLGPRFWSSVDVPPSTQSYWVIESLLPSMYLYRVACGCCQ